MKFLLLFFLLPSLLLAEETGPLTLQVCYQKALERSEALLIQEQELRAAEGRYLQALGGVLPHLSAKGTELIQDTSGTGGTDDGFGSTFLRRSTPEVAVNLTQPLFQGFREFKALSASRADQEKARATWDRARHLLFADIAEVYTSLKERERDLEILESQSDVLGRRIRELKGRVQLGKSRKSEILTTESQRKILEAETARVKGQRNIARETLSFLTGVPPDQSLVELETVLSELEPLSVYLSRVKERPDIQSAEAASSLSRARLSYERGGYFPRLNLEANYYPYRVGFREPIDWDLLFTLELPLFQGGETRGLVREAKARLKQAELSLQESQRQGELQVEEAYHLLLASREEAKAFSEAAEQAKENYEAHLREYRLGLVNNLEVLQALKDFYQLERDANRGRYAAILYAYRLKVAIGEVP